MKLILRPPIGYGFLGTLRLTVITLILILGLISTSMTMSPYVDVNKNPALLNISQHHPIPQNVRVYCQQATPSITQS